MTSERFYQSGVGEQIKHHERIEDYFTDFLEATKNISQSRFVDFDNARKASDYFRESTIQMMNELGIGDGSLVLQFDGEGVMVPKISVENHGDRVEFQLDEEETHVSKAPLEEVYGVITGIAAPVMEQEGAYFFQPVIICRDVDTHRVDMSGENALPIGSITMNTYFQVWCQEDTQVTIPSLEAAREQVRAIDTLDTHCHPTIVKNARRLQHAFLDEDPEIFKELKNTSLLRKIARKTLQHTTHADIIADGMVGIFGRNRALQIRGEVFESVSEEPSLQRLAGSVVDILPLNPQSQKPEPTIVLETRQQDGQTSLYYAPFSTIRDLSF